MEFEKTTVFQISSSFAAKYFADPISILHGGSPPPNMQGIDYVSSPQQVSLHPMRSPYFTFVSIPARLFSKISASMTQQRLGSTTTIVEPPNSKRPFSLPRATRAASGVQHLLHLKSKSKILRPIEIMGFFYEFFCQIQGNNLL